MRGVAGRSGRDIECCEEAEDFQSVGMRCRECLISMVRILAKPSMVPPNTDTPQSANVVAWCVLISDHIAHGSSAERVRGYMKTTSKAGWELVNWLTHTRADEGLTPTRS